MSLDDLPQVVRIEQESFHHPWSADYFRRELTFNRIARYMVICLMGTVVGYVGIWFIVGEVHITTIAVQFEHRRKGLGETLLISVIDQARDHGALFITLEVRASNQAARSLYGKYGFAEVGLRSRYYSETGEDAVIMSTGDISSEAYVEELERLKRANEEKLRLINHDS